MELDATPPVPLPQQGRAGIDRLGSADVSAGTGDRSAAASVAHFMPAVGTKDTNQDTQSLGRMKCRSEALARMKRPRKSLGRMKRPRK